MIPDVPREKLLQAMEEFDKELRNTEEWFNWEQKGPYKYAIVHDGQRYPVKQIISMATGEPRTNFSGGYEANSYVSKRGFSVVALENKTDDLSIHDVLEEILAHYVSARDNEPFKGHALRLTFNGVSHAIAATDAVSKRPTVTVKASMGQGNWATIPWISLLGTRETSTGDVRDQGRGGQPPGPAEVHVDESGRDPDRHYGRFHSYWTVGDNVTLTVPYYTALW